MNLNQLDFALVTSDSLPKKIKSWDSYEELSKEQFLDLVEYSKELLEDNPEHEILFLVVAKGDDDKEMEEDTRIKGLEEELAKNNEKKIVEDSKRNEIRERSKKILNSLYGI
jgi:DNA-directed RNA polymerase specialized sigma subunit